MSEKCFCGRELVPGVTPVCEQCHQPPDICVCSELQEDEDDVPSGA
jgi:hypothetical protein